MKKGTKNITILLITVCVLTTLFSGQKVQADAWKKDGTGWWYQMDNGTYPRNAWKKVRSKWYWFDTNGYMVTGWKKINGAWYYFDANGVMLEKGWHKIGSSYYYMYDTGAMAQNTWIGNEYVDANGVWIQGKTKYVQGWKKNGTRWWYCHKDGSYTKNGWEKINGKYYYFDASGYMITGWKKVNGSWYYLKSDGAMMNSGWLKIKGQWYYFKKDGSMMGAGWHKIKGNYYYMYSSGAMAAETMIGKYYVDQNGVQRDLDISNYIQKYRSLISLLDMKNTQPWQFGKRENSYVKDGFYLELSNTYSDLVSMKNEKADYIKIYGISLGDDMKTAAKLMQKTTWKKQYSNSNFYRYVAKFDGTLYMLMFYIDSNNHITSWYLNNWPEGEWVASLDKLFK